MKSCQNWLLGFSIKTHLAVQFFLPSFNEHTERKHVTIMHLVVHLGLGRGTLFSPTNLIFNEFNGASLCQASTEII